MNINELSLVTDKIICIVGINEIKDVMIADKEDSVLISITEPNSDYIDEEIKQRYSNVLEVKFWDIIKSVGEYEIIPDDVARSIRRFIFNNRDKRFAFHCLAGISRSAAVAQAMECLLFHDGDIYAYQTSDSQIKSHWRYMPNHTVFYKVVGEEQFIRNDF